MTAIECLKILRKGFCLLLIWNLLLTGCLISSIKNRQEEELHRQICNLEAIPGTNNTENPVPQFILMEE